jgi:hypothetical protein
MFDENSPEMRLALAPYEESIARLDARMEEIGADFEKAMAEADTHAAQRDREQAEQLEAAMEKYQQAKDYQPQEDWTAPREQKEKTISFGEFDDESRPASTWSAPTPPMGFPPPPPIPEPIPETPRAPVLEPMMSFGDFEDEEPAGRQPPAPQAPPRPGRRRLREDDDEDLSGQSWLS